MPTVWKAQWPLNGAPQILIYEDDASPEDRQTILIQATPKIRQEVFDGRWIKVFFEGQVEGDTIHVDRFVRHEQWLDTDPLTGEKVP